MKELDYGKEYKYPHDFPDHYVEQDYTSEPLQYYNAGDLGFEKKIRDWLIHLRKNK